MKWANLIILVCSFSCSCFGFQQAIGPRYFFKNGPHFSQPEKLSSISLQPRDENKIQCDHDKDETKSSDFTDFSANLPYQVFLEDTDMYGIVFNSNYIKFFKRSFETCWPHSRIVGIDQMKFRAAAVLGDQLKIKTTLKSVEASTSKWTCEIVEANGPQKFCTAMIRASFLDNKGNWAPLPKNNVPKRGVYQPETPCYSFEASKNTEYGKSTHQILVKPWADEFDGEGILQPSSIATYMERIRTLTLGNPKESGLTKLFEEGMTVVVSKINNFRYNYEVLLGDELTIKTSYDIKRRSVLSKQSVWNEDKLVGHADIELLCIDNETKSLRSFPDWCQQEMSTQLTSYEI